MSAASDPRFEAGNPSGPSRGPDSAGATADESDPANGNGATTAGQAGAADAAAGADTRIDGEPAVDPADPADPGAAAGDVDPAAEPQGQHQDISVEDLVQDLERVAAERDQYLEASRRIQAEFENYRKQVAKREVESRERAAESLVTEILPVLDACDGALASGAADVAPVRSTLLDALVKQGLDRIDEVDEPFDPAKHEAVLHEPGEESGGPVVAEVMRAGYRWNGRVLRPAMVRVRGS